jgi:hypothetical protein
VSVSLVFRNGFKNTLDGKKSLIKIGRFIINMLLLFSIFKLSVKVNRDANKTQITSENILICSELVSLWYVWVSTLDVEFRNYNLPCNNHHRYGLHLHINRKISHASILLLRLHSSYAFFIRAYTHVKVEFA